MNDRTRTLWVPALISLTGSMALRFILQGFVGPAPPNLVNHAGLLLRQQFFWLAALPLFGALSAYLSRREGGGERVAAAAAVFPAAVMVPLWIGMGIKMAYPSPAQWLGLFSGILNWIVLPAAALLLGASPFIKRQRHADLRFNISRRVATFWIPALLSFITAMMFLTASTLVGLQGRMMMRGISVLMVYVPWLLALPVSGAVGAYFSRQAGGGLKARLVAGLFPVIAMTGLVGCLVLVGKFIYAEPRWAYFSGSVLLGAIFPGIALFAGALPFLEASITRP